MAGSRCLGFLACICPYLRLARLNCQGRSWTNRPAWGTLLRPHMSWCLQGGQRRALGAGRTKPRKIAARAGGESWGCFHELAAQWRKRPTWETCCAGPGPSKRAAGSAVAGCQLRPNLATERWRAPKLAAMASLGSVTAILALRGALQVWRIATWYHACMMHGLMGSPDCAGGSHDMACECLLATLSYQRTDNR